MKYTVTLEYIVHKTVEVEAASPSEACEKAREMTPEEQFGADPDATIPMSLLEDGQPVYVMDENYSDRTAEAGL